MRHDFYEGAEFPVERRLVWGCVLQGGTNAKLEHYVMVRIGRRAHFLAWPTDYFSVRYIGGDFYTRSAHMTVPE